MRKGFLTILLLSVFVAPVLADDTTFSSPAGGEVWVRGTQHTITYTFSKEMTSYGLVLCRNGAIFGTIQMHNYTYPAGVYNVQWQTGKTEEGWAPIGSGYTIGVHGGGSPSPYGMSNPFSIGFDFSFLFKIKKIYYVTLPKPGDCPQCFILDLKDLREELIRLEEPVLVGLYWRNNQVAKLGQIGKGQGWPGKLQVKLEPDALAAVNRGAEFELRIFTDHQQLIHSQKILLAAGR